MIKFLEFPPMNRGDVVWTEEGRSTIAKLLEGADSEVTRSLSDKHGQMVSKWSTMSGAVLRTVFQVISSSMPDDASREQRAMVMEGLADDLLLNELKGETISDNNFNKYIAAQIAEKIATDPIGEMRGMIE